MIVQCIVFVVYSVMCGTHNLSQSIEQLHSAAPPSGGKAHICVVIFLVLVTCYKCGKVCGLPSAVLVLSAATFDPDILAPSRALHYT